tara:strand:+ start:1517 stop:2488 length:972 start_codon:yes stop_codon:yes gene_type:complete
MELITPESIVIRLVADKPVRKTPYQVKGVFMKQFSDEKIVPFLDGKFRSKFLYPRVQVKILNEQIYIVGLKEGVGPVLSLVDSVKSFNFGNITINIEKFDIEENNEQLISTEKLLRYKFITPWVALNKNTSGKYRALKEDEKTLYLNKLFGLNILFLSKELGADLKSKIFTKVYLDSLIPEKLDENGWGTFTGEVKTNFILPNYIGMGNGITRGFGTIFSLNNPNSLIFDQLEESPDEYKQEDINVEEEDLSFVTMEDVPIINKRKKSKKPKKRHPHNKNRKNINNKRFKKRHNKGQQQTNNNDLDDDSRFNSEEYHQKQHDL